MKNTLLKFAGLTFTLLLCSYGFAQKGEKGQPDNSGIYVRSCNLTVAFSDLPSVYTWKKAMKACPAGWRLPTVNELKCMCESRDTVDGFGLPGLVRWSSDEHSSKHAYFVVFSDSSCHELNTKQLKKVDKSIPWVVRCVK